MKIPCSPKTRAICPDPKCSNGCRHDVCLPLPPANGDAVRNYRAEEHQYVVRLIPRGIEVDGIEYVRLSELAQYQDANLRSAEAAQYHAAQLRAKDALIGELTNALNAVIRAYGDKTWGTVYAMQRALPDACKILAKARAHTAASMCREAGAAEVAVFSRSDGPPSDSPIEQEE
jgi:hypothetical protein